MKHTWTRRIAVVGFCAALCLTLTSCKLLDWVKDNWQDDTPETTEDPQEKAHNFDITKCVVAGQFDFRGAQITTKAITLTLGGNNVGLTWEKHTWPMYDQYCDGVVVAVWHRPDGSWFGGYIDWCPAGREGYSWNAIPNFYYYGSPKKGDECGFFILSSDCKQRSNVLFGAWPIDKPSEPEMVEYKIPLKFSPIK